MHLEDTPLPIPLTEVNHVIGLKNFTHTQFVVTRCVAQNAPKPVFSRGRPGPYWEAYDAPQAL